VGVGGPDPLSPPGGVSLAVGGDGHPGGTLPGPPPGSAPGGCRRRRLRCQEAPAADRADPFRPTRRPLRGDLRGRESEGDADPRGHDAAERDQVLLREDEDGQDQNLVPARGKEYTPETYEGADFEITFTTKERIPGSGIYEWTPNITYIPQP